MNQVNLIGRLTRDPDVRYNQNQMAVARFNIAINNGPDRTADYPSILAFGKTAENIERYTAKGKLIAIIGHIHTGQYKSKNDVTVYTTDVVADRVEFLEWKDSKSNAKSDEGEAPQQSFEELKEDVPF